MKNEERLKNIEEAAAFLAAKHGETVEARAAVLTSETIVALIEAIEDAGASSDKQSRAMKWLTVALVFVGIVQAIATLFQAAPIIYKLLTKFS